MLLVSFNDILQLINFLAGILLIFSELGLGLQYLLLVLNLEVINQLLHGLCPFSLPFFIFSLSGIDVFFFLLFSSFLSRFLLSFLISRLSIILGVVSLYLFFNLIFKSLFISDIFNN